MQVISMKRIENNIAVFHCQEAVLSSVTKFCDMLKEHPSILSAFKGIDDDVRALSGFYGFELYPTVKKTTLFYEKTTDCFFKILHPLTIKNKVAFLFIDRVRSIHSLSEYLLSKGIKVSEVVAYGTIKKGRKPFFVIRRINGKSLYNILIKEGNVMETALYFKVIDAVAKIHSLGYWLGDAHLSHIFMDNGEVSGFIDIDSIRKNRPFSLKNLARDLAGYNHPELPLTKDEKMGLLNYYMDKLNIKNRKKFIGLLKYFSEKRWKRQA